MPSSRYDKFPSVPAAGDRRCWRGWEAVCEAINEAANRRRAGRARIVVAVECYTGLHEDELETELRRRLEWKSFLHTRDLFKSPCEVDRLVAPYLGGDDP